MKVLGILISYINSKLRITPPQLSTKAEAGRGQGITAIFRKRSRE
jgi:hypothetical protein